MSNSSWRSAESGKEHKPSKSLSDRSLAALKWNYAGVAVKVMSQLIIGVVLARLLGPEPFGLFAITLLVTGVGGIVVEMGLGSALIQKEVVTAEDIRAVFTRLMLTGMVVACLAVLGADWIAGLFNDARLKPVLIGGAVFLVFQSLGVVSASLLKRDLEIRTVQVGQVVSYLIGFLGIGVTMAMLGLGVWSLIAALISQSFIFTVMMYFKVRHPIKPLFRIDTSHVNTFGYRVLLTNLANWAIENMDNFLVGRFYGMNALGLYSVCYNLVRTPTNHVMTTAQTVLFPASARAQKNNESLQRAYLATLGIVTLVVLPTFAGVAAVSGTVVEALYGQKWVEAIPLLLPLALAMPLHAAMTGSVILWGKGLVGLELRVQFWIAIIFVLTLLAASRISLIAMAWGVFVVYFLRCAWLTKAILRSIHLSWAQFGQAVRGGLFLGIITCAVLAGADRLLVFLGVVPLFRLSVEIILGMLVLVSIPALFARFVLSPDVIWLLNKIVHKLPAKLQSLCKYYIRATPPT